MAKLTNSFFACAFALTFPSIGIQSSYASDGGIRVDRQRCSEAVQESQYDLAFMKRIAATAQTYEPVLLRYVNQRYLPLDIRFRNEPYKNESRRLQYEKALEVTRSANFLEINCRKLLAGGNGRAYDQIDSGFESDNRKKYFRESIQIDNEELGLEYETSDHIRRIYLLRMGTVQHEIFHNWSYDHKRHGSDRYNRSMNQVARHALQDSFNSKWIKPENSRACQTLRNCRRDGYLVMKDLRNEDYLAFDPLRRGIGLLSFKNPGNPLDRLVLVDNAILGNELYTVAMV